MSLIRLRSRTHHKVVGTGHFYCPACEQERGYAEKRTVQDSYIFFVIPLGSSEATDEVFIECQTCQKTFTPAVFNLPQNTTGPSAGQRDYSPRASTSGDRPWRRRKWWQFWK